MADTQAALTWQGMGSGVGKGYAWKEAEKVAAYLDEQETPERREQIQAAHAALLDLLRMPLDSSVRFLDLGAGAGAVAASVMARFPRASGILADISVPMMDSGRQKLSELFAGRFDYVEYDMNSAEWLPELSGPFDAVVSARAIHHLSDPQKGVIFRRVHDVLKPGGVFANWDLHRQPEEPQNPKHPVATADAQLELLAQAGFATVSSCHDTDRYRVFYGLKAA